jgi:hypothetical protein
MHASTLTNGISPWNSISLWTTPHEFILLTLRCTCTKYHQTNAPHQVDFECTTYSNSTWWSIIIFKDMMHHITIAALTSKHIFVVASLQLTYLFWFQLGPIPWSWVLKILKDKQNQEISKHLTPTWTNQKKHHRVSFRHFFFINKNMLWPLRLVAI